MRPLLWLRYAARNLRSGLRGFWILITCLTLGVAAIAIIGSLTASIERGLAEEGQPLLGGDVDFSLIQRPANAEELRYIASLGRTSAIITMRAMAAANGRSTLVEIKAADAAYPLYGDLRMESGVPAAQAFHGTGTVAVDPLLLGRLGLKPGDTLKIGTASLTVGGVIAAEPDRIADGIILGPRLLMSPETLQQTGLVQPGTLATWRYRVRLPEGRSTLADARTVVREAEQKFPQAGWRVRATDKAAGGAEQFVNRLGYFMTLVAVAALVVGGAGIANAVSAFVNRRMASIATLKCLGMPNRDVMGLYFTEIILVGLAGIAVAMLAGAAAPAVVRTLAGDIIPLPLATTPMLAPLVTAAVLGLLVLVAFAALPLARIAHIRGAALFRNAAVSEPTRPAWAWLAFTLVTLAVAAGLVVAASDSIRTTLIYLAGLVASFAVLSLLAKALLAASRHLPRPRHVLLRQAIGALHRPGSAAFSVILALGLGLSLFVTLALTDRTLSNELRNGIPGKAPAFFFLDVRNDELATFRTRLQGFPGVTAVSNAPMLRGRITAVKGVEASKVEPKPGAAWALRGDRGLTYADTLPEGSELVRGQWWPKDYSGPPLVSLSDDIADGLGVTVGDKIAINVLGRDIEATVASTRRVNWRSFGINFVMVFSPNTLKAAPHAHLVTVEMSGGDEAHLVNTLAAEFPSVTAVRVKDALATVSTLLGKMLAAVRGANGLTLLTGVLVLAGALAAGLSTRSYEAVVLKTYGASRRQLLGAFLMEYAMLGLVAAVFGVVTGTLGAWFLARYLLELPWQFSPGLAIATAAIAMVLTVLTGLAVTARALTAKPSAYLRNE